MWDVDNMAKLRPSAPNANVPYTLDKGKPLLNPHHSHGYSEISFGANICISSSLLPLSPLLHHHFSPCVAPLIMLLQLSFRKYQWPAYKLFGRKNEIMFNTGQFSHLILPTGLRSCTKRRGGVSGVHTGFTTNRWSVQPCPMNYIRNMIHWES